MNNDPSTKRLSDECNYKTTFTVADLDASILHIGKLLSSFLTDLVEDLNISDANYFLYIVEKGIETIMHVFKTLLLYTRNLELVIYHTEKACVYYIEFISQIGQDSQHLLQLNTRDAILFVYKKTIYEINGDCKKRTFLNSDQNTLLNVMNETVDIINGLVRSVLVERTSQTDKKVLITFIIEQIDFYVKGLIFNGDDIDVRMSKLLYLNNIIASLSILTNNHIQIFNIVEAIFKKISKHSGVVQVYSIKKLSAMIDEQCTPHKIAMQLIKS